MTRKSEHCTKLLLASQFRVRSSPLMDENNVQFNKIKLGDTSSSRAGFSFDSRKRATFALSALDPTGALEPPIQLWASGETTDRSTAIGSRLGLQGMSAGTFLLPRIRVSPKVVVVVLECLGAKFFLRYVDFLELQSVTRSSARVVGYEVLVGPRTVQPLGEALGRG